MNPAYYESLRPADEVYANTPAIPDPVAGRRYLRLFVPISARRADEVARRPRGRDRDQPATHTIQFWR